MGVRMKVVASDLGRYAREAWVDGVTIAPAERYVVDVRFEEPGEVRLVNRVRGIDHVQARFFDETTVLGTVTVSRSPASPDLSARFSELRRDSWWRPRSIGSGVRTRTARQTTSCVSRCRSVTYRFRCAR